MPQSIEATHIVVECQKTPNGRKNRHVCVPKSWVQLKMHGNRVSIVYPSEDKERTDLRVRNMEPADKDWDFYIGDIKAENTYEYCSAYVKRESGCKQTNSQDTCNKRKERESEEQPHVERKESLKVRLKLLKPSSEKKRKKSRSSDYAIITEPTAYSEEEPVSEDIVDGEENIPKQPAESFNMTTEISPQPPETSNMTTEFSSSSTSTPSSTVNQSTTVPQKTPFEVKMNEIIQSLMPETILQQIPMNTNNEEIAKLLAMQVENNSKAANLAFPKLTPEDRAFIINLESEHTKTVYNIRVLLEFVKMLCTNVLHNRNTLGKMIKAYGPIETDTGDQQQPGTSNVGNTQDVEMPADPNIPVSSTQNAGEDAPMLPTSTTGEPNTDKEENGKREKINWILKHPDPGKDLIELGKHSGVYVSADGLKKCKEKSDSVESFAKSLLPEVFSEDNTAEIEGKIMRPPMYFPAKIALVNFAMDYGQQVGWKEMEFELILHSLRDVLHDDLDYPEICGNNDQHCTCCLLKQ
ncbi:hypothetical protein B5X24_HaOG202610 [Helicoverpa armigera]|uniref:Uncharacterized protein n=1 Tax=Helicoverpa armigera TaxID=29058 RepID=A0A2W1BWQ2_HELAM|nr:hypothetical protein B5X24_HaOG202610 [Helicoverpa armigera]